MLYAVEIENDVVMVTADVDKAVIRAKDRATFYEWVVVSKWVDGNRAGYVWSSDVHTDVHKGYDL